MVVTILAEDPKALQSALDELRTIQEREVILTLQIYTDLGDQVSPFGHQDDVDFGPRLLEPLYDKWIGAIRGIDASHPVCGIASSPTLDLKVTFDLTRPLIREPNATNFTFYEARGLTRMTALLGARLRGAAKVEGNIIGLPCWCVVETLERCLALPRGQSWPQVRHSHVIPALQDYAKSPNDIQCMKLAAQYWDAKHWEHGEDVGSGNYLAIKIHGTD